MKFMDQITALLNSKSKINYLKQNKVYYLSIISLVLFPILISLIFLPSRIKINRERKAEYMAYEYKPDSFTGNTFVTQSYPIFKDLVLCGDSYAHFVSLDLGFDFTNYSCPGLPVLELSNVIEQTSKSGKKYACIFIGPNDFFEQTNLKLFSDCLNMYIKKLRDNNMKVILCTYLSSLHTDFMEKYQSDKINKVIDYQNAIIKLVNEENDVFYLDLLEYNDHKNYLRDEEIKVHYNYDFNVKFINKLYKKLLYIISKCG